MLYQGVLITNASGKLGGSVWSRNRGGPYVRANGIPTGGPTPEQIDARAAMGLLVVGWQGLTETERQSWHAFSRGIPRKNRIGEARQIGGQAEYFKANLLRIYAFLWLGTSAIPLVTVPPSPSHGAAAFTPPTVEPISPTDTAAIVHFNTSDPWWTQTGAGMLLFTAPARTPTVNYFRGPWTLNAVVGNGDSSPQPVNLEAPAASGDRLFVKARISDQWGQLSPPFITHVDVP